MIFNPRLLLLVIFFWLSQYSQAQPPQLMLANTYHLEQTINLSDYWISEKLDGIRAYWDGTQLVTRNGNRIKLPDHLKKTLPKTPLDGELWLGRQTFDKINALIHTHTTTSQQWRGVQYKVFDLPKYAGEFNERLSALQEIYTQSPNDFWSPIEQFKVKNQTQLEQHLLDIEKLGGEGLMLHKGTSLYAGARTNDLLKLKSFQDAEAIVIGHTAGKGKYTGIVGALIVKTEDGVIFNIGTGLSDADRAAPPTIGSIITYKYFGLTHKGTPRFASYLRTRSRKVAN